MNFKKLVASVLFPHFDFRKGSCIGNRPLSSERNGDQGSAKVYFLHSQILEAPLDPFEGLKVGPEKAGVGDSIPSLATTFQQLTNQSVRVFIQSAWACYCPEVSRVDEIVAYALRTPDALQSGGHHGRSSFGTGGDQVLG